MKNVRRCAASAVLIALCAAPLAGVHADAPTAAAPPLYATLKGSIDQRVETLLSQLTQAEKLSLLAQQSGGGNALKLDTPPIPRLGIPSLRTCDSPSGVRDGQATAFPMEIIMASTWDPELIRQVGAAIGQEARVKNRQVIYGPDLNIQRSPQSGRGFECFSEDPYIVARMGTAYVEGMQSQGVAACVKHYVCNDQETNRHSINITVAEQPLHQIYLFPFEAALRDAHTWSIMPSFNQTNGEFMAQNEALIQGQALTDWKWDGVVISDWGAVHDTAKAVNAGTDIEMPDPSFYKPDALTAALNAKQITQTQIDDMVRRVLRATLRTEPMDGSQVAVSPTAVNSPAHQQLALKVAQDGIVLLKNDSTILPLDLKKIKSIAVIGPNASDTQLGGRWSADVNPFSKVSVLEGIQKLTGTGISVQFAAGCPRTGASNAADIQAATALAAKSDVAVVVVGMDNNYEGEELDPPNIDLPGDQDKLIQAVAAANKNTIVILNNGTPVDMTSWIDHVPGVIEGWYAGEEQGDALAGILSGAVNPSGKLTETIGAKRQDYSDFNSYPGTNGVLNYSEGIFVGYRHFDKANIKPLFPFGFGLSYTSFAYSGLKMSKTLKAGGKASVQLTVKNTGHQAGDEIVELYVHDTAQTAQTPVQEMKGFQRVSLLPGQKTQVKLTLDPSDFAVWDTTQHAWNTPGGKYEIWVGASSRDIRLRGTLTVAPDAAPPVALAEDEKH